MAYQQSSKTVVAENTGLDYESAYRFKLIKIVLTFTPDLRRYTRMFVLHRPSNRRISGSAITSGTVTWTFNHVFPAGSLIINLLKIGSADHGNDWKKDRSFWGKIYVELM